MVHENWRFRPWYRELRSWLAAGELGEVVHASMEALSSGLLPDKNGHRRDLERQPFMAHEARLMIEEVMIHHLDVMRFLCGPLRVVAARAAHTVEDVRGETLASIFLETAAGAPVVVTGTMAAAGFAPRGNDRLVILGSKASAALDGMELALLGGDARRRSFAFDHGYQQSFDATIAHFVECLRTGEPFETDILDNLETLRLVEHAYWAAGLHGTAPDRRGTARPT
jgi:predicted dehydrogenase